MGYSKIVYGIVGLTIAVIMVAVVAIPIIDDSVQLTEDETVIGSEIRYEVDPSGNGAGTDFVLVSDDVISVDGTEVNVTDGTPLWVVGSGTYIYYNNNTLAGYINSVVVPTGATSIEIESGTSVNVTTSTGTTPMTYSGTAQIVMDPKGDHALWNSTTDPKAAANDEIFAYGITSSGFFFASGTLTASSTPQSLTAVVGSAAATVAFTLSEEVYTLDADSVAFASTSTTADGIIAPIEQNVELTPTSASTMLGVVPIMLIVVIVMMAVGMIAIKRGEY